MFQFIAINSKYYIFTSQLHLLSITSYLKTIKSTLFKPLPRPPVVEVSSSLTSSSCCSYYHHATEAHWIGSKIHSRNKQTSKFTSITPLYCTKYTRSFPFLHMAQVLALGFDCWVEKPCSRRQNSLVINRARPQVLANKHNHCCMRATPLRGLSESALNGNIFSDIYLMYW